MEIPNYDGTIYDYTTYWDNRLYENESEFIALKKLLPKEKTNLSIIDIGGGFGRFIPLYTKLFSDITIFDYSSFLLDKASENAKRTKVNVDTIQGDIYSSSSKVSKNYDYAVMIRVSHHLADLNKALSEIYSILKEDGIFVLEVANKVHFKNVISNLLKGNFKFFTKESISVTTKDVTFLNHHPKYVEELLKKNGFIIEKQLSVSNFRNTFFKKIPLNLLLTKENMLQSILSCLYFGPSIFYKVRKVRKD